MKTYIPLFAFILLFSIPLFSNAQNNNKLNENDLYDLSLEQLLDINIQLVSTQGEKIFNSPSTVTVINSDEIQKYNFLTIEEVLQTVAGIKSYRTYLKRNLPTARGVLQDHYANKVLVLVDGTPVWNAVTGEGNIDRINIKDIDRIEILKGPASVLYGTNAFSGAINIVLRKTELNKVEVFGGYGTNNSYESGLNAFFVKNKFEAMISVSSSDNIGPKLNFKDEKKVTSDIADHLKTENITFSSQYKSHKIDFNIFRNAESYYGVLPTFASGAGVDHKLEGYFVNYAFSKDFSDKLNLFSSLTYDLTKRNLARDSLNIFRSNVDGSRIKALIKGNYKFLKYFSFELGMDYEIRNCYEYNNYRVSVDTVTDNNKMDNLTLNEYSLFSQLQYSRNKLSVLIGNRYTNNELFGNNFSSRGSMVYSLNTKNSIKLIYGESFRAPSFFEYYFYSTAATKTVFGNKNLKPEKSKSLELAYLTSFNKFFVQALLYHAIYENKIFRTRDTLVVLSDGTNLNKYPNATVYVNGKTFTANGVELEIDYANPGIINGFVNYSYVIGDKGDIINIKTKRDTVDVYNFFYIPQHNLAAGAYKTFFNKLTFSVVYNYISGSNGPFESLPAYQLLDFNLIFKHRISKLGLTHILSAKNIFDEHILIPEYSRVVSVNAIPYGTYRFFGYTLKLEL